MYFRAWLTDWTIAITWPIQLWVLRHWLHFSYVSYQQLIYLPLLSGRSSVQANSLCPSSTQSEITATWQQPPLWPSAAKQRPLSKPNWHDCLKQLVRHFLKGVCPHYSTLTLKQNSNSVFSINCSNFVVCFCMCTDSRPVMTHGF